MLAEKELLPKVKKVHLACTDFLAEKQNKAGFRSGPPFRSNTALELIHTDVCYVDAKSHSRGHYFVTFIDDHNRKL